MNRSLLLVEHDPDQLDLLTRCLIHAGYQVVSVHHSRRALEAASFRQFQVALLDASLPEMNAFELMRRLKQTQDHLQFVILSGRQHPVGQPQAEDAFTWLVTPCRTGLLEATVEDACEQAADQLMV